MIKTFRKRISWNLPADNFKFKRRITSIPRKSSHVRSRLKGKIIRYLWSKQYMKCPIFSKTRKLGLLFIKLRKCSLFSLMTFKIVFLNLPKKLLKLRDFIYARRNETTRRKPKRSHFLSLFLYLSSA